jgi:hypothetical protein
MKLRIVLICFGLFLLLSGGRGESPGRIPVYSPNEVLKFQMYYGLVNAGEILMTLEPADFNGEKVLHATALGYTTGLADRLFRIYDVYESYMDPETGLPVKAIRNIREGNYRYYNEVLYDRDSNLVISQLSGIHEVPPGIMDMVSAIYKLRDTINFTTLRSGDVLEMTTFFSDKVYPVKIRYRGTETIRTRKGKFHALKFSPVSEPGRVFKSEDDITVWLSNDRNLVPLRISLNMLLGSIRVDLIETNGLKFDLIEAR